MVIAEGLPSSKRCVNIRPLREGKLITQKELAKMVGMSEETISRIENGHRAPRFSTIKAIARALKVDPVDLWIDLRA